MLGKPCSKCSQLLTESNYFEIPEMNNKKRYFFFGKIPESLQFGKGPKCNDCAWPWFLAMKIGYGG